MNFLQIFMSPVRQIALSYKNDLANITLTTAKIYEKLDITRFDNEK